jgi:hypothetical protein
MTDMRLRPFCKRCGWRKGGTDSWNGLACKCGETAAPLEITVYDDAVAKAGGWAVFRCDDGIMRIQRLDDPRSVDPSYPERPRFESDDEAVAYVIAGAKAGSGMMMAALALHGTVAR